MTSQAKACRACVCKEELVGMEGKWALGFSPYTLKFGNCNAVWAGFILSLIETFIFPVVRFLIKSNLR